MDVLADQKTKSAAVDLIEIVNSGTTLDSSPQIQHPDGSCKRSSQSSVRSQVSRALSFNGSIQLKDPEDIVPQFEFVPDAETDGVDPRQHVFNRRQKRRLVYLVSISAMFSPLSSNIYFPAVVSVSQALRTSVELVALTITIYMIFQGLAPSFWGPLADTYGRRPILLCTLAVYVLANLGLALSPSFPALMAFRGIQAIGSASTIAIGAGIIGDISIAAERGGFMGLFGGIRMFGQAFGPVLGGTLAQFLGFRSIFWFLFALALMVIILMALVLPETLPKIAGNGSLPLYGIYKPLINLRRGPRVPKENRYVPSRLSFALLIDSFKLLLEKDVIVTLIFGGFTYTVWSMITSSTASLFKDEYHLSDVFLGLVFIPNGLGCVLGSLITGKIMDRDYNREASRYRKEHDMPEITELKPQNFPDFPIERARLRSVYILNAVFVISTALYGTAVEWHMAIPLILQFFAAFSATAIFNINSTIMIDLYPSKPASATAINNLVRCTMGGIGVGFVEKGIDSIKEGPVFLLLATISWVSVLLVTVETKYGPKWRRERSARQVMLRST